MILTNENYFSLEADNFYLSNSQYHDFMGGGIYAGCESRAMAKLRGEYKEDPSTAMLLGSYVDEFFSGNLSEFKAAHPEILTIKGELRAEFKLAEEMIKRIQRDKLFMDYISGEQQVIMTAEMFGIQVKAKLDSYHPGKLICDLKTTKSIRERVWNGTGKVNFIEAGGYLDQMAIYQEVVRLNTGDLLPVYVAAVSKETPIDIQVIQIPQLEMDMALSQIRMNVDHIKALKNRDMPPTPCHTCSFCIERKVLTDVVSFYDI